MDRESRQQQDGFQPEQEGTVRVGALRYGHSISVTGIPEPHSLTLHFENGKAIALDRYYESNDGPRTTMPVCLLKINGECVLTEEGTVGEAEYDKSEAVGTALYAKDYISVADVPEDAVVELLLIYPDQKHRTIAAFSTRVNDGESLTIPIDVDALLPIPQRDDYANPAELLKAVQRANELEDITHERPDDNELERQTARMHQRLRKAMTEVEAPFESVDPETQLRVQRIAASFLSGAALIEGTYATSAGYVLRYDRYQSNAELIEKIAIGAYAKHQQELAKCKELLKDHPSFGAVEAELNGGLEWTVRAYQLFKDTPKRFDPFLVSQIHVGDVLVMGNGSRAMVTEKDGTKATLVQLESDGTVVPPTKSHDLVPYFKPSVGPPLAKHVERSDPPSLFGGKQRSLPNPPLDFNFFRPGDILHFGNGNAQQEILRVERGRLPFVTSLVYTSDGALQFVEREEVPFAEDDTAPLSVSTKVPVPEGRAFGEAFRDSVKISPRTREEVGLRSYRELAVELEAGEVLQFTDGARRVILNNSNNAAEFIRLKDGEIRFEHTNDVVRLLGKGSLATVEKNTHEAGEAPPFDYPTLVPGKLAEVPYRKASWNNLEAGTILHWEKRGEEAGVWEEVVSKSPGANNQLWWVDVIRHHPDGRVEHLPNQYYNDEMLASPGAPRVAIKIPLDIEEHAQNGDSQFMDPDATHPIQKGFDELFSLLEKLTADRVQALSDRLSLAIDPKDPNYQAASKLSVEQAVLEEALLRQKILHELKMSLMKPLDTLASYATLQQGTIKPLPADAFGDSPIQELMAMENAEDQALAVQKAISMYLGDAYSKVQEHAIKTGEGLPPELLKINAEINKSMAILFIHCRSTFDLATQNSLDVDQPLESSVLETDPPDELLEHLSRLKDAVPSDQLDDQILVDGVVISKYSAEGLRAMVDSGAKIITYRTMSAAEELEAVEGFLIYYEPGTLPTEAKKTLKHFKPNAEEHEIAYVDLVYVHPSAQRSMAHKMMLEGMATQLQRTTTKIAIGEQHPRNQGAFKGLLNLSGLPHIWHLPKSPIGDGRYLRWLGMTYPIDPRTRQEYRRWSPVTRAANSYLGKLWDAQAQSAHPGFQNVDEERAIKVERMAAACRLADRPVLVRPSCGVGNMDARCLKRVEAILPHLFENFAGAMLYPTSEIVTRNPDGSLSLRQHRRAFGNMVMDIAHNNPGGIYYGMSVETEEAADVEIEGQKIRIVNFEITRDKQTGEEKAAGFATARMRDVRHMEVFTGNSADPGIWENETDVFQECGELLMKETKDADGNQLDPFRPLLITFGGGGVIAREIQRFVDMGWDVMLVEGTGGATDNFIKDLDSKPELKESLGHVTIIRDSGRYDDAGVISDTQLQAAAARDGKVANGVLKRMGALRQTTRQVVEI